MSSLDGDQGEDLEMSQRSMSVCVQQGQIVINAPNEDSRVVTAEVHVLFAQSPDDLSGGFNRSATLMRIALYLSTAASQPKLKTEMMKISTRFNNAYNSFCGQLQKLRICSHEMFERFKTACLYYSQNDKKRGDQMLQDMRGRSRTGRGDLDKMSKELDGIQNDINKLMIRQERRMRGELGMKREFELHARCLSYCLKGIQGIQSFLDEQKTLIVSLTRAFDIEESYGRMQSLAPSVGQLVDKESKGMLYEIHKTIVRCVAAKKASGSYAHSLDLLKPTFSQMLASYPSQGIARETLPDMIREFNRSFPEHAFDSGADRTFETVEWGQPPKEPWWPCVIQ